MGTGSPAPDFPVLLEGGEGLAPQDHLAEVTEWFHFEFCNPAVIVVFKSLIEYSEIAEILGIAGFAARMAAEAEGEGTKVPVMSYCSISL